MRVTRGERGADPPPTVDPIRTTDRLAVIPHPAASWGSATPLGFDMRPKYRTCARPTPRQASLFTTVRTMPGIVT